MRRPHSAKPEYMKTFGMQSHGYEEGNMHENTSPVENANKKNRLNLRLTKPQNSSNFNYQRFLPRKIPQDKERMYSELLQYKKALNELTDTNLRLKTRINILEKEKERMNKYIQNEIENGIQIPLYSKQVGNKAYEKENNVVRNLRKAIREQKQVIQSLEEEVATLKKIPKFTKIKQLQIQRDMLLEENKKINKKLLKHQGDRHLHQNTKKTTEDLDGTHQLDAYINSFQENPQMGTRYKKSSENLQVKDSRVSKEMGDLKKHNLQQTKKNSQLEKEIHTLKEQAKLQKRNSIKKHETSASTQKKYPAKQKNEKQELKPNELTEKQMQKKNILGINYSSHKEATQTKKIEENKQEENEAKKEEQEVSSEIKEKEMKEKEIKKASKEEFILDPPSERRNEHEQVEKEQKGHNDYEDNFDEFEEEEKPEQSPKKPQQLFYSQPQQLSKKGQNQQSDNFILPKSQHDEAAEKKNRSKHDEQEQFWESSPKPQVKKDPKVKPPKLNQWDDMGDLELDPDERISIGDESNVEDDVISNDYLM